VSTIINQPPQEGNSGNGMGFLLGIIVLAVIIFLFFYYGLPAIRGTQVNVPDQVDVNVNDPSGGNDAPATGSPSGQ
jgi:hypothetical protein